MDVRRLELYELLKPKLDAEPAKALVVALGPEPDELATKTDLRQTEERLELKMAAQESRIISTLTWRMTLVMGAWTAVATSLYGFMAGLLP